MATALIGVDVVINAAGAAAPDSNDIHALHVANALLPATMAAIASRAGVRRFVHVSSAAVQGARRVLDETRSTEPFSPYSTSKADGERALLEGGESPAETVVYRPTSVIDEGRPSTLALARLANAWVVPVAGDGSAPLPTALVGNVASLALHLATCDEAPQIVLHPWEGMTQRLLMECLAERAPRFLRIPRAIARPVISGARHVPRAQGASRRLELLLFGQQIDAE